MDLTAHDDGIWCCAWQKRESDGQEVVITGSLDNTLKLWNWFVLLYFRKKMITLALNL